MSAKKKRRSSLTNKVNTDGNPTTTTTTTSPPSPTNLLFRILPFWISVCAIGLGVYMRKTNGKTTTTKLNNETWTSPDPRLQNLISLACSANENNKMIYCHDSIQIVNRTIRVTQDIPIHTKLFEIPRSMQLWDLDAYRDPYIRKHLFKASHKLSGNRLGSEAYLAAYLAVEMKRSIENPSNFDSFRLAYFDSLPTLEEFQAYHPIVQEKQYIADVLGRSMAYSVVQGYRNMINSEWEAIKLTSTEFTQYITRQEYIRARLIVLTRVIDVGRPGPEEVMPAFFIGQQFDNQDLLQDELMSYKDLISVDLTKGRGCIALIPIVDLFNHHPNNNIQFQYQQKKKPRQQQEVSNNKEDGRSLIVASTNRIIDAYTEPMVSYGTMSDAHLYGRYGFSNGDGSGPIQLSIAFHHELLKLNISNDEQYNYIPTTGITQKFRNFQRNGIVKYLMYDDGYTECIPGPSTHPEEAELKRLKMEHLLKIANDYNRWNMLVPPCHQKSLPAISTHIPITLKIPHYEKRDYTMIASEIERIQETCRYMSLINNDFNGQAVLVLKDNLNNPNFRIGPNVSDALEFRSFMCISRWFGTRLVTMESKGKLHSESQRISMLNKQEFGSKNWTAYHVRFGEMQALQAAIGLIFGRVSESWEDKKTNPEPEYTLKDESCPEEYSKHLFQEDELIPHLIDLH